MQIDLARSGLWIRDLHVQLQRGRHALLYGNVFDQQLVNGRYCRFREALELYFAESGYEVIGHYDLVDGLTLLRPENRPIVDEVMAKALGGSSSPPSGSPPPQRTMPRAGAVESPFLRPEQALDAIRHVLAQPHHSAAFVVDFSDKMTGDPDRFSEDERRWLVMLRKALDGSEFITDGKAKGRRNALITVAGQLGGVPSWFYKDNPLMALVRVNHPSRLEREFFFRQFSPQFHAGEQLSNPPSQTTTSEFADLTDGMTVWDLEAIRRTSLQERLSVAKPKALVDFYRYGAVEDPWEQLDASRITSARTSIGADVLGQAAAVSAVIDMLVTARVGLTLSETGAKAGKPKGVFFFVGPTGVGKTELAKALSKLVFGDQDALDRYDMSEYAEKHAAEKLAGSPPGYVGYDEGGRLTNRVITKPFSLLLFDEVEKADPLVLDKFLQILEDGRLTDAKGQTAYFSQSVIIFTSNIGSDTLSDCPPDETGQPAYATVRAHYLDAVRKHFTRGIRRPELLNRLGDNILVFDMLRPAHIDGIAQKFLGALARSALQRYELSVMFDESILAGVRQWMQEDGNMQFGGRRIKTLLDASVVHALNRWCFLRAPAPGVSVRVTLRDGEVAIE